MAREQVPLVLIQRQLGQGNLGITSIYLQSKRGRPTLGSAPATVESVRLDPELRAELLERAQSEGTTTSEIIREALRRFLHPA